MKEKVGGGNITFVKPNSLEKGQVFGNLTYLESKKDRFDKPGHKFKTIDGNVMVFNSSGSLDYKIGLLTPGDVIDIVYLGKEVLKGGKYAGKEFHSFEVMRDVPETNVKPIASAKKVAASF